MAIALSVAQNTYKGLSVSVVSPDNPSHHFMSLRDNMHDGALSMIGFRYHVKSLFADSFYVTREKVRSAFHCGLFFSS